MTANVKYRAPPGAWSLGTVSETSDAPQRQFAITRANVTEIRKQFAGIRFTPGRWEADTVAALRLGWDAGWSTIVLGEWLGLNKNAIVGKAHRLHLPARPSPLHKRSDGLPHGRPGPRAGAHTLPPLPSITEPVAPPVIKRPVIRLPDIHELRRRSEIAAAQARRIVPPAVPAMAAAPRPYARTTNCVFPIGEPGTPEFRFCDEPHKNRSYCDTHVTVCYVRTRRQEFAEI